MWVIVTATLFTLGCVSCQEPIIKEFREINLEPISNSTRKPPVPPGPPPELMPIDASDDIYRPGFLNSPNAHFIFSSRTNRVDIKPLIMQVDGDIRSYITRRTRPFADRFTNEDEERTAAPTTPVPVRTRETVSPAPPPSPPPPPAPVVFEAIQNEQRKQQVSSQIAKQFEHQRLLSIKAMAEEIDRIRSRSQHDLMSTVEAIHQQAENILAPSRKAEIERVGGFSIQNIAPAVAAVPRQSIASTASPVVRRRVPMKTRRPSTTTADYEETERATERSNTPRKPLPPIPFPTLSPWIDGYGK